ncbi:MAG: preprotein translocase subunit YajC [Lentisphaeria bacterium]|nr:preprotein translocase subunit YajC [Lentisphaerota bacterium]MBR2624871.1 preprotein translocase subunit YajC [Lentisphaeria bacterium]
MNFKKLFLMLSVCGSLVCAAEATVENAPAAAPAPAAAQTAAPAAENAPAAQPKAQQQGSWKGMIVPILLIVGMIFLFSRANKKQQRQRQEMLDKIVKGSKVLLQSGVYGKVVEDRGNDLLIEIAENVRVLVVKAGIANVETEDNGEKK